MVLRNKQQRHLPLRQDLKITATIYKQRQVILRARCITSLKTPFCWRTTLLLRLGRYSEALIYGERATRANPQSSYAFWILGYAHYKNDQNKEAIAALKTSLALHSDDKVQQLLERVERESRTEADFHQEESNHFTLRYEGSQVNSGLRQQILN